MAVELTDDSSGVKVWLKGAVAPLKVLRTLMAYGAKELGSNRSSRSNRKTQNNRNNLKTRSFFNFQLSIFIFTFFHSSVNSLSEAITPFNSG